MSKKRAVSIIIPTYNEEKYLPGLLESITRQDFKDFEVIVADKPSNDGTKEVAKKFGCVVVAGGVPSRARNEGAKLAKADVLLFLDADIILPKNFISDMLHKFRSGGYACATVHYRPLSNHVADKAAFFCANFMCRQMQKIRPHAAGWCIMIKKELFEEIGGFNITHRICEDHDLVRRAAERGKFGVMRTPFVWVSTRRLKKEGRIKYGLKVAASFVLYNTVGIERTQKIINYEFGKF
ncbi:glycosyltransferase [Candidatus Woesearchaeota archaeon]|nr:glycosyltransferase [Candidatus Woesearchaeota archaeon]